MFRSIVVGVDGSGTSLEALRRAAAIARALDAELTVVTAYKDGAMMAAMSADPLAGAAPGAVHLDSDLRATAEDVLARAVAVLDGEPHRQLAVPGEPSEALISTAERLGADLIVVGNKGMTGAKRLLLGSVPNRVAHHAACAVLIVPTT